VGWAIPKQPPFIPPNWTGQPDRLPYPDYLHAMNTKEPQPFPEKGDLTKPWSFGGKSYTP
jgi:sulfonate transport system substrate-binding protein